MSKVTNDTLKGIGLQFFAEEGAGDTSTGEEDTNQSTGNQSGKTFTQEDVNRLLKAEKESAKKALLKELGVEDAKTAKEGLSKYKELLDKDKTDAQKAQDNANAAEKARVAAESRAILAEAKVEVLSSGCKSIYLEDVMTLAMSKVSDEKNLQTVIKEMKEDQKYSSFFVGLDGGSGDKGTGGGSGFKKKQDSDSKDSLGSRLGAKAANSVPKNPYFTN